MSLRPAAPTLFFDRDVGIRLPETLERLRLGVPIEFHQKHFPQDAKDDEWMPEIGARGWTLIGHDSRHHLVAAERAAIMDYQLGCFYLWGNSAPLWEKMRCFLRAFERILHTIQTSRPPFIFRITETGRLTRIAL